MHLPDALSPQTTHCSTPKPPAVEDLGGDLLVSAEAIRLIGDDEHDRSLGDGVLARFKAPLESIFISCLMFFLRPPPPVKGALAKDLTDTPDVGVMLKFGLDVCS